jgi:hypothetical protein
MNIEFHGFPPDTHKDLRDRTWSKIICKVPHNKQDRYTVTFFQSEPSNMHGRAQPFIRLYSKDTAEFETTIQFIRDIPLRGAGITITIECVALDRTVTL